MSWGTMLEMLATRPEALTSSEWLVFVVLRIRAAEKGNCWPSQLRIVRDTGLSERKVRESTDKLERLGLIRASKREGDHRRKVYEILAARQSQGQAKKGRSSAAAGDTGKRRHKTGYECRQQPAPVAYRRNQENLKESGRSSDHLREQQRRAHQPGGPFCTPEQLQDLINGLGRGAHEQ
jgi:DNA-binding MarR family transcriptional regulator